MYENCSKLCWSILCTWQDVLECRQYLRVLNGKTATATALIMFNLGTLGVIGKRGEEREAWKKGRAGRKQKRRGGRNRERREILAYLLLSSPPALITLDEISRTPNLPEPVLGTVTAGLNSILWVGLVSFPFVQVLPQSTVGDFTAKLVVT